MWLGLGSYAFFINMDIELCGKNSYVEMEGLREDEIFTGIDKRKIWQFDKCFCSIEMIIAELDCVGL